MTFWVSRGFVWMTICKRRWALWWLKKMILWVPRWRRSAFVLWAVCKKGLVFQSSWKYNFCSSLRVPGSAAMPLLTWGTWVCRDSSEFSEPVVSFLRVIWFGQGIQLIWPPNGIFLLSVSILLCECTWRLSKCYEKNA